MAFGHSSTKSILSKVAQNATLSMERGTPKAGNCYKQVLVRMIHWEYFHQVIARGTSELSLLRR